MVDVVDTALALLRGHPAPSADEEPTLPAERAALRLAVVLGRGDYASALSEPLAAALLDAPDCGAAVQAYLQEHTDATEKAAAAEQEHDSDGDGDDGGRRATPAAYMGDLHWMDLDTSGLVSGMHQQQGQPLDRTNEPMHSATAAAAPTTPPFSTSTSASAGTVALLSGHHCPTAVSLTVDIMKMVAAIDWSQLRVTG